MCLLSTRRLALACPHGNQAGFLNKEQKIECLLSHSSKLAQHYSATFYQPKQVTGQLRFKEKQTPSIDGKGDLQSSTVTGPAHWPFYCLPQMMHYFYPLCFTYRQIKCAIYKQYLWKEKYFHFFALMAVSNQNLSQSNQLG